MNQNHEGRRVTMKAGDIAKALSPVKNTSATKVERKETTTPNETTEINQGDPNEMELIQFGQESNMNLEPMKKDQAEFEIGVSMWDIGT
jgi:hypothetical protein